MFNIIQDPTVTPKELAFCFKELQAKVEKLITEKKLLHEQLLSLQRDVRGSEISEPESDSNIKKQIEEKKSRIKTIIIECEAILVDMGEIRNRMAGLIPKIAKKRLDEIREAESHSFTKKKRKMFRKFFSAVAMAVKIKQDIDGRQGENYNFEFKFNSLGDRDKKFFINEIKRIRDEAVDNGESGEGSPDLNDEIKELEKAIKERPFVLVDKLLKEVGAKVRNR